ncbi:MAG: polyprenyl synthetase family protein [Pseudomonadales bacterium]|nr:polyprenyl synthetase family protein [Pseudomonadales bacterium]
MTAHSPAPAAANPTSGAAPASLDAVFALVRADFTAVNALIPNRLTSDVELVEKIGAYIVESGGKRLRPLLVLLGTRALDYQGEEHIKLAAVIEFLHTATLLHDDVVDHSNLRRGRATANALWGNAPSVLVGDFLYSRAFQLMVELGRLPILDVLSSATNIIAQGEVQQLANIGRLDVDEGMYRETIRAKTALLFEAATHTAGLLASTNPGHIEALRRFGLHFGMAYQLVDDCMDYASDSATMGKNAGDDLAEGKLTLPLIHALAHGSPVQRERLIDALRRGDTSGLSDTLTILEALGSIRYARDAAFTESEAALDALQILPDSDASIAMRDLTRYCTSRLS